MTVLCTSYELLMNFLWTPYALLMTFLCTSYDFLIHFLWLSSALLFYKLLLNFLWLFYPPPLSKELLKNVLQMPCQLLNLTVLYELYSTFLRTSQDFLTKMTQRSYKHIYFSATFSTFKLELKSFSGDSYKLLMNFVSAKTLNREQQW
jgi:hypothetical protein